MKEFIDIKVRNIKLNDVKEYSYIETEVDDSNLNIIFIHAFPLSKEMFLPQAEFFEENGIHAYFIDLPGFGNQVSLTSMGKIYAMDDYAKYIKNFIDFLNIKKIILGGVSMGGYISLSFCKLFSELLEGLILMDTRANPDTEEGKKNREETAQKVLREGASSIIESLLPKLICDKTKKEKNNLVQDITYMMKQASSWGIAGALRGMAIRPDYRNLLPTYEFPVLIVVGEEDLLSPIPVAEEMNSLFNKSTLIKVPNAGHLANLESSELVNKKIYEFVKSLK